MAELYGEWSQPVTDECLVGQYIHSFFESPIAFEQFKTEHPEIISSKGPTKGQLKEKFRFADAMIDTLKNDPLCAFCLEGQKEVIMTGNLFDTPWKIKMDVYNPSPRRIVDLKTTRNINELIWSNERGCKLNFIDAYNYPLQFAIYCEIERQNAQSTSWAEPYIVAVSKEDPPDKEVISLLDDARFVKELYDVQENMPRILDVKFGGAEPVACGKCPYCRGKKRLSKVKHYSEIGY